MIHLLFIESLINFQCFWFLFRTRFWFFFSLLVCVCCCSCLFCLLVCLPKCFSFFVPRVLVCCVLLLWEFSYYFVLREIVMLGRYLSIMELRYLCLQSRISSNLFTFIGGYIRSGIIHISRMLYSALPYFQQK